MSKRGRTDQEKQDLQAQKEVEKAQKVAERQSTEAPKAVETSQDAEKEAAKAQRKAERQSAKDAKDAAASQDEVCFNIMMI